MASGNHYYDFNWRNLLIQQRKPRGQTYDYLFLNHDPLRQMVRMNYKWWYCDTCGGGGPIEFLGPGGGGDCGDDCRYWQEDLRYFIYDQFGNVVEEYEDTTLKKSFVYAGGQRIGMVEHALGAEYLYYYLNDRLGSTSILVDGNTPSLLAGYIRASYDYYAYGGTYQSEVSKRPEYLFTGQRYIDDNSFNLYYFGARFYDPETMRFISVDPAGQYFSPYIYGGGRPTIGVDPDGEFFIIDDFIIGYISKLFETGDWGQAWDEGTKRAQNSYDIWRGLVKTDPNQSFWGQLLQVASRFSWEICQTSLGLSVNLLDNTYGGVKSVDHAYGATLVETYRSGGAYTLGPYISGWEGIEVGDEDFMHEYGHYIQSRWLGPFYLSVIAWPSLGSAVFASHHERFYTETWANKWALDFFGEKFRDYYNREYGIDSGYRSSINRYGDFDRGWTLYGNGEIPSPYAPGKSKRTARGLSIR